MSLGRFNICRWLRSPAQLRSDLPLSNIARFQQINDSRLFMMRDKTSALDATLLLSWWKEEEEEQQDDLEEDLEHLDEDKGEEEKGENEFETRKEQDYLLNGFDKQLFV